MFKQQVIIIKIYSISGTNNFLGESLTPVGKPAPPIPTIPLSAIILIISSFERALTYLSTPKVSTHSSSKSLVTTIHFDAFHL